MAACPGPGHPDRGENPGRSGLGPAHGVGIDRAGPGVLARGRARIVEALRRGRARSGIGFHLVAFFWRAAVAAEDHFLRAAAVAKEANGAAAITLALMALGLRTSRLPLDKRRSVQ